MTKHASSQIFMRFVQGNYSAWGFTASVLYDSGADSGKPVRLAG